MLNRRTFLGTTIAAGGVLAAPALFGQAKPRVVVIGGGAGGATAARYLAKDGAGALDVTLIEANLTYTTCFFSNLYIGGFRTIESLEHGYGGIAAAGVNVIHDLATGVDRAARTVTLAGGQVVAYDRLVLSPGIDFRDDAVPGWSLDAAEIMPHAYKAGPQTKLLRAQIEAMPQGGLFAMVAPPNPYRCPPGPYERISMVAHVLKQSNPTAKILLLDPKEKFAKQALFEEGWQRHYDGMIEVVGPDFGGAAVEVRPGTMEVVVDGTAQKVECLQRHPRPDGRQDRPDRGRHRRQGLGPGRSGQHEVEVGRERLRPGRFERAGRHAEVGLFGQQPGQGRRTLDPGRADRRQGVPGQILEHLLVADRARRRGKGRRGL